MSKNSREFYDHQSARESLSSPSLSESTPQDYADLIDEVYPFQDAKNLARKRLSPEVRAAEFAPFAALTGFDDAISATETETLNQQETETLIDPDATDYEIFK